MAHASINAVPESTGIRNRDLDIDLRRVRYFLALGEKPHFRNAAARLFITQPALSRQIRLLEEELHVNLLHRDGRSVELTDAGRRLMAEGPAILNAATSLLHTLRDADAKTQRLRIAFMCGIPLKPFVRRLTARHPHLIIDFVWTTFRDQTDVLRDGRADVAFVRTPFDQRGLHVRALYTEPWIVAVPDDHVLAGRESVVIADLADEVLLQEPDIVPEWRDLPGERRPARIAVGNLQERLEHVAAGQGMMLLPARAAVTYQRDGLVQVPVDGVQPNQVLVAWKDTIAGSAVIGDIEAIASQYVTA